MRARCLLRAACCLTAFLSGCLLLEADELFVVLSVPPSLPTAQLQLTLNGRPFPIEGARIGRVNVPFYRTFILRGLTCDPDTRARRYYVQLTLQVDPLSVRLSRQPLRPGYASVLLEEYDDIYRLTHFTLAADTTQSWVQFTQIDPVGGQYAGVFAAVLVRQAKPLPAFAPRSRLARFDTLRVRGRFEGQAMEGFPRYIPCTW
ncbi:hypothetical protein [Rhodothermus profundi]|uniref:Lipoprotein n=1 Tax=Rhodothermus profundi TaxID=633813 RepID=A0A1M6XBM1_9BACT|nr:hypothetical protein [Rhodothermus profundi]SHL03367.1 hypothetical protein SAMN04488087_2580 [Rhodothermus profundi]